MHNSGTRHSGLPKVSGKACAQYVETLWAGRGQKTGFTHSPTTNPKNLGVSDWSYTLLYTNCIQLIQALVGNFTSVKSQLYTLYTGPINTTTTTFIYKKGNA